MNLCGHGHEEVCFDGGKCPFCEMIEEKNSEIEALESEIGELKSEINELKEERN